MSLKEVELQIQQLNERLSSLKEDKAVDHTLEIKDIVNTIKKLEHNAYRNLENYDRVYLARKKERPNVKEYIENVFDEFIEMHGDRLYKDDASIVGGIAMFRGMPVTVIGHQKGRTLEENITCNFGMSCPEGYRKAMRLMKQAEKFKRPIVTFIDTPGAYPGLEAEQNGIGEAIAKNLMEMSMLKVPVIAIIIGEGGSGGALALGVGDRVIMLENAIYSILSPEGFASILWKDGSRASDAADVMKLTANDLLGMQIIDDIIKEPLGGITKEPVVVYRNIKNYLDVQLKELKKLSVSSLLSKRYEKFRKIGSDLDV